MKKLFTLLFILVASVGMMFAEKVKIGELYYYLNEEDQTAEVVSAGNYTDYAGDIIIPSSVNYKHVKYNVVSIGSKAFYNCSNLTNVDIPNSVINIGEEAFQGTNLSSMYIPTNVQQIGVRAFLSCNHVTFNAKRCNDFNELGWIAETNSISLGDSVEYLPNYYYLNLYRHALFIPKNLKEIGPLALENNIADFYVDANNQYFSAISGGGEYYSVYFSNYNHLLYDKNQTTLIKFGNAGEGTTKIKIPATVTYIADRAFSSAPNLVSITCYAIQPPALGYDALVDVNKSSCKLYVPKESLDIYKSTDVWKEFFSIEAIATEGIENASANSSPEKMILYNGQILILRGDKVYTITGQKVR